MSLRWCALITVVCAGCSGTPSASEVEQPRPEPGRAAEPPVVTTASAPESEPAEEPVETIAATPERDVIPDDGRPAWWFHEVRREEGALEFCVETIAEGTLRDARRSVIDVANERAALEVGRLGLAFDPAAVHLPKSWGWPLPDLPGRERRYAGYALVRVELAGLERAGER